MLFTRRRVRSAGRLFYKSKAPFGAPSNENNCETLDGPGSLYIVADELQPQEQVQTNSGYAWRQIGDYRWLCVTEDVKHTIVGGITKEGLRRYRIQLAARDGILLSQPIIFEHFKRAQSVLKKKLAIHEAIRRQVTTYTAICCSPQSGEHRKTGTTS